MFDSAMREDYGKLLADSGCLFWELDRNRTVVYANDLVRTVFGEPVGLPCHEVLTPIDDSCPDCPVQRVLDGADQVVLERKVLDRHGNPMWLQHNATPIKNDHGEIVGVRELLVDITQYRVRQEWIEDSERLYRNLVEEVPDIIFSLDQNGKFIFVNNQMERLLGYPVREILEKPLKDYVSPDDHERVDAILKLEPEAIWDEEVTIVASEMVKKYVRIRCKASIDRTNQVLEFDGVMRDRTVRRSLEEELKASKSALIEKIKIIDDLYEHIVQSGKCKAIEEHTAEVAHELRQPLAIVGGFARRLGRQLDSEGQPNVERQRQYIDIIVTEIQRLEKILDRLIDFTRRTSIPRQTVNPNELIEYIIGITEARMREKQLRLEANLGLETGDIPLDPGRFQQLVLNLFSNAIEASPVGGVIDLMTGVSIPSDKALRTGQFGCAGFFELKMHNNGPVIPPEAIQNVFNPFFTTKQHGTGLGLTVCKKIVEDHFGSISVKSDENGTVFTIWLPLTDMDTQSSNPCFLPSVWSVTS